jgi:hypothetical protein
VVVVIMVTVMVTIMVVVLMMIFTTILATILAMLFTALLPVLLPARVLLLMAALLVVLALPLTYIPRLVFPRPYEVHLPVARMILVAMQAPGPGVLGRNVQIQRLCHDHMRRRLLDDDRPGIDQSRRRSAAEVHATIDTRRNLSPNGH